MKKLLLAVLVFALAVPVVNAQTPLKLGAGVFGGLNIPIVQKDQASGSVFGFRARVKLIPLLTFEPNLLFAKYGKPGTITADGGGGTVNFGTTEGSKITGFGLDVTLGLAPGGVGIKPFFAAGIGSFKQKNNTTGEEFTHVGYKAGLGLGIGLVPKFDIDVRGMALIIPLSEGGSKKSVMATAGLTYNLLGL